MKKLKIKNEAELEKVTNELRSLIENGNDKFLFIGELAAGKSTIIRKLISTFGVDPKEIKSPTYNLKKEYKTEKLKFHHIDLYRLETVNLEELEIEDNNGIYLIEWANKSPQLLKSDNTVKVFITIQPDESRIIEIYC